MQEWNKTAIIEVANSTITNITSIGIENITAAVVNTTLANVTLDSLNESKVVNVTSEFGSGDIDSVVVGYLFIALFCVCWIVSECYSSLLLLLYIFDVCRALPFHYQQISHCLGTPFTELS